MRSGYLRDACLEPLTPLCYVCAVSWRSVADVHKDGTGAILQIQYTFELIIGMRVALRTSITARCARASARSTRPLRTIVAASAAK